MSDERLKRAVELVELARQHREVMSGVGSVLKWAECASIGHLANEHPDWFEELYEAMTDMVAQLPTRENGLLG